MIDFRTLLVMPRPFTSTSMIRPMKLQISKIHRKVLEARPKKVQISFKILSQEEERVLKVVGHRCQVNRRIRLLHLLCHRAAPWRHPKCAPLRRPHRRRHLRKPKTRSSMVIITAIDGGGRFNYNWCLRHFLIRPKVTTLFWQFHIALSRSVTELCTRVV